MKPSPQNKVGIITVNYNNSSDTLLCVKSLMELKDINDHKIYVVDNGSTDKSPVILKKVKGIELIRSKINLGFAGGNNIGIKKALADGCNYIFLINNDAEIIDPETLTKLINNNKGITAPIVSFVRGKEIVYDYGGKIDKVFGRNTHYESPFKIENLYPTADYYSGVCLMVSAKVFEKIGFLDDSYFLYYEDVDFCLRAAQAGFKLKLCPNVTIMHMLSASTKKLGKQKIKILADSHFRFCLNHLPPMSTLFFLSFNIYLRLKTIPKI